jgi:hypothetical protein
MEPFIPNSPLFPSPKSYNLGGCTRGFAMNNLPVHVFFVGRALAIALGEQLERALTNSLSELGKFDAEQRERLHQFATQVMEKAQQDEAAAVQARTTTTIVPLSSQSGDLQATLDELRAEVARLRTELQRYRSRSL